MPPPDRRRVLIVAAGLSPQVVTETLWWLAIAQSPSWTPDELVILTTREGARLAREHLTCAGGRIESLGRDHGRPDVAKLAARTRLEVIGDDRDGAIRDVDTASAHEAAADRTLAVVRELTAHAGVELHASIAGGRKSQGALLALCLSLFGREGDVLSHVLVDEPFIGHPDFFYPPPQPILIDAQDGTQMSTAEAKVRLAQLPFPRLRARLPPEAFTAAHFADTVVGAQRALDPPRLAISTSRGAAFLNGDRLDLPPALFAWLAALAHDRCRNGGGLPRTGLKRAILDPWIVAGRRLRPVIDSEQTQEWTSRLNKLVSARTPSFADRSLVEAVGARPHTRYRLAAAPGDITWLDS